VPGCRGNAIFTITGQRDRNRGNEIVPPRRKSPSGKLTGSETPRRTENRHECAAASPGRGRCSRAKFPRFGSPGSTCRSVPNTAASQIGENPIGPRRTAGTRRSSVCVQISRSRATQPIDKFPARESHTSRHPGEAIGPSFGREFTHLVERAGPLNFAGRKRCSVPVEDSATRADRLATRRIEGVKHITRGVVFGFSFGFVFSNQSHELLEIRGGLFFFWARPKDNSRAALLNW